MHIRSPQRAAGHGVTVHAQTVRWLAIAGSVIADRWIRTREHDHFEGI